MIIFLTRVMVLDQKDLPINQKDPRFNLEDSNLDLSGSYFS